MAHAIRRLLDVAIHHRRSGGNPEFVRSGDDFDPARNRQFVGAELPADAVIQDFGRGAGNAAEPFVLHHLEVIAQRQAGLQYAIVDLHRRKGMDVHGRKGAFDGAEEVAIKKSVEVAGQSALNADFRGAVIPSFPRAPHDFVEGERVSIRGLRSAAKSAKTATHETHVCEIDVAVDNVGDGFAYGFAAQIIRDGYERLQSGTFRGCQLQGLLEGQVFAMQNGLQRTTHGR